MVSPDFKINTNQDSQPVDPSKDSGKPRALPKKNFDEVVGQLDHTPRHAEEEEFESVKKKKTTGAPVAKTKQTPSNKSLPSLFSLAGGKGVSDENDEEEGSFSGGFGQQKKEESSSPLQNLNPVLSSLNAALEGVAEEESAEKIEMVNSAANLQQVPLMTPISPSPTNENVGTPVRAERQEEKKKEISLNLSDIALNANPQSAISPLFSTVEESRVEVKTSTSNAATLQELIDQIASSVQTIKTGDKTETVVDLKGRFNGSHLIITQEASAPGSVNITIDNLTAEAQKLINAHKASLVENLEKKQVTVHLFIATTTIEGPKIALYQEGGGKREQGPSYGSGDRSPGGQQKQQKKQYGA